LGVNVGKNTMIEGVPRSFAYNARASLWAAATAVRTIRGSTIQLL